MKCNCGYTTENKKSFSNHLRFGCKSKPILTIKFQRKPTHFSRWMNLVDNFINIFGSLK